MWRYMRENVRICGSCDESDWRGKENIKFCEFFDERAPPPPNNDARLPLQPFASSFQKCAEEPQDAVLKSRGGF